MAASTLPESSWQPLSVEEAWPIVNVEASTDSSRPLDVLQAVQEMVPLLGMLSVAVTPAGTLEAVGPSRIDRSVQVVPTSGRSGSAASRSRNTITVSPLVIVS